MRPYVKLLRPLVFCANMADIKRNASIRVVVVVTERK